MRKKYMIYVEKKRGGVVPVLLFLIFIFTLPPYTYAQNFTDGDFKFSVIDDKSCTVTGTLLLSGDLNIPATSNYNGKELNVTKIGDLAFFLSGFTGSLTIPNSVTSIGENAFYGSYFTGSLNIGNSVTSIGKSAFHGCSGFTGSLTIPESVNSIGNEAFYRCSGFTGSLTIGNSVTEIGVDAFWNCSGFTGSLTIPNSVTSIGESAFYGCSGFTGSLTIGNSVTSIGDLAFYDCSGFTGNLLIPNSVTSIGKGAFSDCSGFTGELTIGNSVTSIGRWAFSDCSGFITVTALNPTPPTLPDNGFNSDVYDNAILRVHYDNLVDYKSADGWKNFNNIIGIMTIGGIDYEIIPGGGENGEDVVKVTGGNQDSDGTLLIPDEIEIDGKKYPVTEIVEGAFKDRTDIKKLIIPASVVKVGEEAFSGCTNLIEVIAEDGEKTLNCGEDAFKGAPVKTLYLGRNTTGAPFAGKDSLTDLTIGDKVTSIGSGDFAGCGSIKNITVLNPVPPTLPDNGFDSEVYTNATLRVPDENTNDYKSADGWKNFFNILGVSDILPIDIEMELADIELTEGETKTLKAILTPENATINTLTWSSSDEEIATVDANGLVTAIKPGKATIIATTVNGLTASCEITVIAKVITASGLTLNIEEVEIIEESTLQLTATIEPEDVTDKTVTWNSSDEAIATVDAAGLVTAIKPGKATITATTANGLTASCEVTVIAKTISATGLALNTDKAEIIETSTLQLTATIEPEDVTDKTVTWSSSDEAVATVDATGLVTAIKPGKAAITAETANGLTATCEVTVVAKPSGIEGVGSEDAQVRVEGGSIIAPEGSEVYDLSGRRVAANGLRPGVYIVRIPNGKAVKIYI